MSFEIDLTKSIKALDGDAEKAVRTITIKAYSDITQENRVRTGRSRASWKLSSSKENLLVASKGAYPDTKAGRASGEAKANKRNSSELMKSSSVSKKAVDNGADIIISNNLPYVGFLEHLDGMVAKTVQRLSAL